jgi:hypothetical protein
MSQRWRIIAMVVLVCLILYGVVVGFFVYKRVTRNECVERFGEPAATAPSGSPSRIAYDLCERGRR